MINDVITTAPSPNNGSNQSRGGGGRRHWRGGGVVGEDSKLEVVLTWCPRWRSWRRCCWWSSRAWWRRGWPSSRWRSRPAAGRWTRAPPWRWRAGCPSSAPPPGAASLWTSRLQSVTRQARATEYERGETKKAFLAECVACGGRAVDGPWTGRGRRRPAVSHESC